MTNPDFVKEFQQAIEHSHDCKSKHLDTKMVVEKQKGKTLWEATVEVFQLIGHDKAKQCYGWTAENKKGVEYVTILKTSAINTPKKAVQAWIANVYGKKS